ncbi:MAG: C45 family autoproteolytic acyltransferase/hydrolase [Chloroflexi bacterium]|nr:C45 family autoproteolytic acyltransferase/hydrolase [Chloroflexota bacterium]
MNQDNPERAAGRFPELTVSGTPAQMGHQIGERFRDQIVELSDLVLDRFNRSATRRISWSQAESVARRSFKRVGEYFPGPLAELNAIASAAGVPVERLMVLNARNMLGEATGALEGVNDGCTSLMVAAEASESGIGFAGQNWDNDPAMAPFSAVITRKGNDVASFTSWSQAGLVAYIGFNSAGIGVCMNALNGPSDPTGVPWYFFVRAILESRSADAALHPSRTTPRSIAANAAMITDEGPLDLELTPGSVQALTSDGSGILVHTNHCVHPSLVANNDEFGERIYGQSFQRKDRGQELLQQRKGGGKISVDDVKAILSDHDGFPTSICRHPNDDPATGWQRSVVSLVLEPREGRMQVSNGNPCANEYATYLRADSLWSDQRASEVS